MEQRVIIAGGTGLIGEALSRALAERGYAVIVLSRSPAKVAETFNHPSIRGAAWNGKDQTGWGNLVDGAWAVVNLAGETVGQRWSREVKHRLVESRLNATRAVVEAINAARQKPTTLLQASAVGYYGNYEGEQGLTEDGPPGNDFLAQLCQKWEASTLPVEAHGVRRLLARLGVVLSAEGGAMERLLLPFKLGLGGPIGSGRQWFSWIHLDDVVSALCWLLEAPEASGVYNLTAPTPLRNRDFSTELGRALHRPAVIPVPGLAIELMLGEGASTVLEGQNVVPHKLLSEGFQFKYPTAYEAFKAL